MQRDYAQLSLGPVNGKAGDVCAVSASPTFRFKGEKLVAIDSAGGHASLVKQLYIDAKPVFPDECKPAWWRRALAWILRRKLFHVVGVPSFAFNHLGSGLNLPVCPPNKLITVEIVFLIDGEWRGILLGQRR